MHEPAARPSAVPAAVPAAASTAVRPLLAGPVRPARLLAAFATGVYVETVEGQVLAVVAAGGHRLPNALVAPVSPAMLAALRPGQAALVGADGVRAGGMRVVATRWWDPRPVLPEVPAARLAAAAASLAALLPDWPDPGVLGAGELRRGMRALDAAAAGRDARLAGVASAALVGLGPGLTPAGDDLLAGALAAARLFDPDPSFADALAAAVDRRRRRTTTLSAGLLEHAAAGAVAAPAAALCRALAGRGELRPALGDLLQVGHTSGAALAHGLCIGLRAALSATRGDSRKEPA